MIFFKQIGILLCLTLIITIKPSCQNPKEDSLPHPIGFVNDFEDIFTLAHERYLDSVISAFEKKTTIQIALITIDTFMTSRSDFDNYVFRIADKWGIGQKEKSNGITIGISKGFRKMRIENGSGISDTLSGAETKNIVDNYFIPDFKQGKYFEGTVKGLQAIISKLK